MSVKKTLSNLNGKLVTKKVTGVHTVETTEVFKQELLDAIEENKVRLATSNLSVEDFKDEGDKFTLGKHFWMKPKLVGEQVGILTVRSKDYYFTPEGSTDEVYGDIKGLKANTDLTKVEKSLINGYRPTSGGVISFELIQP